MRKSLRAMLLMLPAFCGCGSKNSPTATRNTYNLVGVTLANGATVTGQFDWNDVPGSFSYTNVNLVVGGSGPEAGFDITMPDPINNFGLCFVDPPTNTDFCGSTITPSVLLIFGSPLTPNENNTAAAFLTSDTICVGICYKGTDSQVDYADGLSVEVTGGSVVLTPSQ